MDTARCPLDECHGPHELHTARNGRQFVVCDIWKQKVFFNPGTPTEYLASANNGRAIENPNESDDEPLPRTPHPNFQRPSPGTEDEIRERILERQIREQRQRLIDQGIDPNLEI